LAEQQQSIHKLIVHVQPNEVTFEALKNGLSSLFIIASKISVNDNGYRHHDNIHSLTKERKSTGFADTKYIQFQISHGANVASVYDCRTHSTGPAGSEPALG